ncbi:hypothetical protein [Flavobacterium sp.]|uniref:hypothetical protein n=1 Tax=Flavobacterium sp. TaxID=239 RepID=UPI004047166C
MDCLRSFSIRIDQTNTFTTGGNVKINTWGSGTDLNLAFDIDELSTFKIQGFKNIDVYGCAVNGIVRALGTALTGKFIVEDWSFEIELQGTPSLISGETITSPNFYALFIDAPEVNEINIGKYTPKYFVKSPVKSVQNILFKKFSGQGIEAETVNTASLEYDLNFTFYYKYEGE